MHILFLLDFQSACVWTWELTPLILLLPWMLRTVCDLQNSHSSCAVCDMLSPRDSDPVGLGVCDLWLAVRSDFPLSIWNASFCCQASISDQEWCSVWLPWELPSTNGCPLPLLWHFVHGLCPLEAHKATVIAHITVFNESKIKVPKVASSLWWFAR